MVLPKFLRRGVGTKLVSRVTSWAKKHNTNMLYATLNPNNAASARLLSKLGFRVVNWRKACKRLLPGSLR